MVVIDADISTNVGPLASIVGRNNVVNRANCTHLRQHQQQEQQPCTSGVGIESLSKVAGSGFSPVVSSVVTDRSISLPNHQPDTRNGMINHSSLILATNTHQQQQQLASIKSSAASPLGGGMFGKKTIEANSRSSCSSNASPVTNAIANPNTNSTTTTTTTATSACNLVGSAVSTPTDTVPTAGATELPLDTKETIVEEEQEEEPEIDIVINNVVCSFSVRCHLNLREIALNGYNVEFRRENGMVTMKLRRPYTTASIWSSGKITCTGATSEAQAKTAARRYSRCLQKLGFNVRFKNFRIVNVLGTCSMPWGIMIVNFSEKYKKDASYEPELHPGVTYKLHTPKATLKIFSTGSITVTAASVAYVQQAIEHIFPLVYEFRKKRSPLEKLELMKQPAFDPHDVNHLIEEDCDTAMVEADDGVTCWNGTSSAAAGRPEEQDEEDPEAFGDDEDVCNRNNTKAIHKMNSIRQNGKKRGVRQYRPFGRVRNDGDSMSDDDLCVSDFE
ncbi:AGAP007517-PA-like protein [Anopheles sinensis]|uniref:TATA box-binding protein-like 1 n=1 Tax=Anopheles sinensis TaxID=74873 RepID=A0A084WNE5_ANOSI|nr:AGAP007517-PA-like protein [Anopheles sinensis]